MSLTGYVCLLSPQNDFLVILLTQGNFGEVVHSLLSAVPASITTRLASSGGKNAKYPPRIEVSTQRVICDYTGWCGMLWFGKIIFKNGLKTFCFPAQIFFGEERPETRFLK